MQIRAYSIGFVASSTSLFDTKLPLQHVKSCHSLIICKWSQFHCHINSVLSWCLGVDWYIVWSSSVIYLFFRRPLAPFLWESLLITLVWDTWIAQWNSAFPQLGSSSNYFYFLVIQDYFLCIFLFTQITRNHWEKGAIPRSMQYRMHLLPKISSAIEGSQWGFCISVFPIILNVQKLQQWLYLFYNWSVIDN